MSVRQVVRCDRCEAEISRGGFHIGLGPLHWADGEVDLEMHPCVERTFELCNSCAIFLSEKMPVFDSDLVVSRFID